MFMKFWQERKTGIQPAKAQAAHDTKTMNCRETDSKGWTTKEVTAGELLLWFIGMKQKGCGSY